MGLIAETAGVFDFLHEFFFAVPVAIRLLVLGSFGGMIYLAIMKMFRG